MNITEMQEKWKPILEHDSLPPIESREKKGVVAALLENTEQAIHAGEISPPKPLVEAGPTNSAGTGGFGASATAGGPVAGYDPILINLVRRAAPNLMHYDVAGVQAMSGPTGTIFAMRSRYAAQDGAEAGYNEANTAFSGDSNTAHVGTTGLDVGNTSIFDTGTGMDTETLERLGHGAAGDREFGEMAVTCETATVTADGRALKAEYSREFAQDLRRVHGLDAHNILVDVMTTELLAEINRELVRTLYRVAKEGSQVGTATPGTFDLDVDSNGRHMEERFKGLIFQVEREANAIGRQTRRGKGNIVICSSDVASALEMVGLLNPSTAYAKSQLNPDDNASTYAGMLANRMKVFVDPYAGGNYMVVGYKGSHSFDAGVFYCPYIPVEMYTAQGENTFNPKIGFKTRYGMIANPFGQGATSVSGWTRSDGLDTNTNVYYRRTLINNLM